ncbi:hypothetical protein KBX37_05645 [Micromonospora sp. U56]|uniref:hypothetical protein n=1 Tax=Micromonospora sp. U56 TaxID=2824900 RepID=UPI001B392AB5|nr:hypothetical protein [Micromonospora sp. U56]MBQ0892591.1 hypothetical protein [Micromonospora sp. U56]
MSSVGISGAPGLAYFVLYRDGERVKPSGILVVDMARGHAVIWDHRQRSWSYNPDLAFRFLGGCRNDDRYEPVDRCALERIAVEVTKGVPLPSGEEINQMFSAGAAGCP